MLNGQKLQGTITTRDAYKLISSRNVVNDFPLIKIIYEISFEGRPVESIIEGIAVVTPKATAMSMSKSNYAPQNGIAAAAAATTTYYQPTPSHL